MRITIDTEKETIELLEKISWEALEDFVNDAYLENFTIIPAKAENTVYISSPAYPWGEWWDYGNPWNDYPFRPRFPTYVPDLDGFQFTKGTSGENETPL